VVADVPRLPSGKVLRRVLRDQWMQSHPQPQPGGHG
jgi:acyl-coenzyme A synthetase/AMP-(fatty) acid ligase